MIYCHALHLIQTNFHSAPSAASGPDLGLPDYTDSVHGGKYSACQLSEYGNIYKIKSIQEDLNFLLLLPLLNLTGKPIDE